MPVSLLNSCYIACRKMACQKMNQDVAYACNTESGCKGLCQDVMLLEACNQFIFNLITGIQFLYPKIWRCSKGAG